MQGYEEQLQNQINEILDLFRDAGATEQQLQKVESFCRKYAENQLADQSGRFATLAAKCVSPMVSCLVHTDLLSPLLEAISPILGPLSEPITYGCAGVASYFVTDALVRMASYAFIRQQTGPDMQAVKSQLQAITQEQGSNDRVNKALIRLREVVAKQEKILQIEAGNRNHSGLAAASNALGFMAERRLGLSTGALIVAATEAHFTELPERPAESELTAHRGLRHRRTGAQ